MARHSLPPALCSDSVNMSNLPKLLLPFRFDHKQIPRNATLNANCFGEEGARSSALQQETLK